MKPIAVLAAALLALMLTGLNSRAQEPEAAEDLLDQVLILQERLHIDISGLDKLQNEPKAIARGSMAQQFEQLLRPFNLITSRNAKGQIERVVIIDKKQARETRRIVLPTRKEGKHLIVSVSLSGDGRLWQTLDMILDTGADVVVLPDSMIAPLGFTADTLTPQTMQTANGAVKAKIGVLQELAIAGETLANVDVAFIADKQLGDSRLLGMSVLGRYQVNIDDQSQSITLLRK